MKVEEYFKNRDKLEKNINKYRNKGDIRQTAFGNQLSNAHIEKSNHNLEYVDFISKENKFNDWQVIGIYYATYHIALALLAKKGWVAKNHTATIQLIIKEYTQINKNEIEFIEDLHLEAEDVKIYTELKQERENANYSTNIEFKKEKVRELRRKAVTFINKAKKILRD